MSCCPERQYLKRRASQELGMTLHADCVEAEHAHNQLTGLYLGPCVQCLPEDSDECRDCSLRAICERARCPAIDATMMARGIPHFASSDRPSS